MDGLKGRIDYPLIKKTLLVELTEEDIDRLKEIIEEIAEIKRNDTPPQFLSMKLCKKCAYHDLCFI